VERERQIDKFNSSDIIIKVMENFWNRES